METLVQKYPCHIATSASVLQQLLDNHAPDFSVAWDIPVVIRNHGSGSGALSLILSHRSMLVSQLLQKKTRVVLHTQIWVHTFFILKMPWVLVLTTLHILLVLFSSPHSFYGSQVEGNAKHQTLVIVYIIKV